MFKLAVVEFILVILTSCESFVVLAADAEVIKLPLTTPISVNLVFAEPVYVLNEDVVVKLLVEPAEEDSATFCRRIYCLYTGTIH